MTARTTRMQNANRFKLGLFGMNCSGSFATTAPERWQAGWPENLEAARLADEAGLEFILPIARWMGYGGQTDRQGTSFEIIVVGGGACWLPRKTSSRSRPSMFRLFIRSSPPSRS